MYAATTTSPVRSSTPTVSTRRRRVVEVRTVRDGVTSHAKRVVAGSSPASGGITAVAQLVEHLRSPLILLPQFLVGSEVVDFIAHVNQVQVLAPAATGDARRVGQYPHRGSPTLRIYKWLLVVKARVTSLRKTPSSMYLQRFTSAVMARLTSLETKASQRSTSEITIPSQRGAV